MRRTRTPRAHFSPRFLELPSVDAGDGWLIFRLPGAEVAVHPTELASSGRHELYLVCDDVTATVADLQAKGVEFVDDVSDQGGAC